MVSSIASIESRADALTLIGGELAFDFANTSSGRGWPTHQEHLRTARDLVVWAGHARVLPPADTIWLREAAQTDAKLGERLLAEGLSLREDIYVLGSETAAGRSAPPDRLESLARVHARCLAQAALAPFKDNFVWSWTPRTAPVEAVLGPIALSAMTTLLQADLSRIKQCQGEKCGWLFFDATKNKSRRWCEMEICGNRAKQKRFGAKARGA